MMTRQQGTTGALLLMGLLLLGLVLGGFLVLGGEDDRDLGRLPAGPSAVDFGQEEPQTPTLQVEKAPLGPDRKAEEGKILADHGTILGRLVIEAGDQAPVVNEYTIWLEEARSGHSSPKKQYPYTFRYYPDQGEAGTFRITPIPHFGAWRVVAVVPGMNADEVVRVVDAHRPVAQVELVVEKGQDLTVNVQDPERNAYNQVDVTLHPLGRIPGRHIRAAKTDMLGNAVFRGVVKGDWKIQVNQKFRRLAPPRKITLGPGGPRLVRIEIPRGGKLEVTVLSPGGAPLAGIDVQAYNLHARKWEDYNQKTDKLGVADFGKLPPGKYQLRILNVKNYQRHHEPGILVEKDQVTQKTIYLKFKR